jgi:hypothetical protein
MIPTLSFIFCTFLGFGFLYAAWDGIRNGKVKSRMGGPALFRSERPIPFWLSVAGVVILGLLCIFLGPPRFTEP